MSMELYVALPTLAPISIEAVMAEGQRLGLDLTFDEGAVFEDTGGFQSGTLAGTRTGVEIDVFGAAAEPEIAELFDEALSGAAQIVAFRWHGNLMECAFAMAVAATLVSDGKGVCFDPQEDAMLPLERILASVRDAGAWRGRDIGRAN